MFTEDDYKEYFEQIASLERVMIYSVYDALLQIEDPEIRQPLETVARDERRHYGYIRDIFESILFRNELEKRKYVREHILGRVTVKRPGEDDSKALEGYCVDLSNSGGVCVEFDRQFSYDGEVQILIEPFDGSPPRLHLGKFVWNAPIGPRLQMGGIRFKGGMQFTT